MKSRNVSDEMLWEAEESYIGDNVYDGMLIITDIADVDGEALTFSVSTGSKQFDRVIAHRIINSLKTNAELLEALEEIIETHDNPYWSKAAFWEWFEDYGLDNIRAAISKAR